MLCSVTTQIAMTGLPPVTSRAIGRDAVVRAVAARRHVRVGVAVEARVDEIRAREALGVAVEERQVRVDAHPELLALGERHDLAEIVPHHGLAAREAEPADAHRAQSAEEHVDLVEVEVRRIDERAVAVRAAQVAAVRHGERRRERPRRSVDHVGEEARAVRVADAELLSQPHE
jgi:hypothetical protein